MVISVSVLYFSLPLLLFSFVAYLIIMILEHYNYRRRTKRVVLCIEKLAIYIRILYYTLGDYRWACVTTGDLMRIAQ